MYSKSWAAGRFQHGRNVLPLARCFARTLQIPVELLGVVD